MPDPEYTLNESDVRQLIHTLGEVATMKPAPDAQRIYRISTLLFD